MMLRDAWQVKGERRELKLVQKSKEVEFVKKHCMDLGFVTLIHRTHLWEVTISVC